MKSLLWLALVCCGTTSFAHSELVSAKPADASVLSTRPAVVTLTFSEAVEPSFSTFMLRPLTDTDTAIVSSGREAFIAEALTDASDQFDMQPESAGASETVILLLPEDLPPGEYAVVWRALSVDTHTMQDLLTFTYRP